jgi:hypothetical protein
MLFWNYNCIVSLKKVGPGCHDIPVYEGCRPDEFGGLGFEKDVAGRREYCQARGKDSRSRVS